SLPDRTVDRTRAFYCAVVAGGELDLRVEFARGPLGEDIDHACRGVLAEQGALRPLQHFNALQLAEIAEADAVARAVYAVDHDADRRLQPGVVADRADAADTRRRDGFIGCGGHYQARREEREVLDVPHAGVLQELLGDRGDDDRYVLQALFALLRRDDDSFDGAARFWACLLSHRRRRRKRQGRHYGATH